MEFCHIAPTSLIDYVAHKSRSKRFLVLAHLIEKDVQYVQQIKKLKNIYPESHIIVDNSAFEYTKQGRPMLESSKLIDLASRVNGDYIVMSDYPNCDWQKTVDKASEMIPKIKQAGFKTFFCPQSRLGDIEGYLQGLYWGLEQFDQSNVDLIGISILACPIAMGIKEGKLDTNVDDSYKLQRYLARYTVLNKINKRRLESLSRYEKPFHMLGMTDGPREIELMKDFKKYIASWDSSAGVWLGCNNRTFDNSCTGLRYGKFEKEVDFDFVCGYNEHTIKQNIEENIKFIDDLVDEYLR